MNNAVRAAVNEDRVNTRKARSALTPAWAVSIAGGSDISTRRSLPSWLVAASGGADLDGDDTIEVQRDLLPRLG